MTYSEAIAARTQLSKYFRGMIGHALGAHEATTNHEYFTEKYVYISLKFVITT